MRPGHETLMRKSLDLHRLDDDARLVDRLVALGDEGMASGIDEMFDIDAFIEETRTGV